MSYNLSAQTATCQRQSTKSDLIDETPVDPRSAFGRSTA